MNSVVSLSAALIIIATATIQAQWEQCPLPFTDPVYTVAASNTTLLAGTDFALFSSPDGGIHWKTAPFQANYHIAQLYPTGGDTVFALEPSGIHRSTDNGRSFTRLTLYEGRHIVGNSRYLFAMKDSAILISNRDGSSFKPAKDSVLAGKALTALTMQNNRLFAGTKKSGVFVSDDTAALWTAANNGIPADSTGAYPTITFLSATAAQLYLWCDSGMYISRADSVAWIRAGTGLDSSSGLPMCLFVNGTTVLAGTDSGLYCSSDSGTTWKRSDSGLPVLKSSGRRPVYDITRLGEKLYAGTAQGVYCSINGGLSWNAANNHATVNAFTGKGNYLYAGTQQGAFRSADNGTTWVLPDSSPRYVNSFANSDSFLIAGTGRGGWNSGDACFSADSGITWKKPSFYGAFADKVVAVAVLGDKVYAGIYGYEGVSMSPGSGKYFWEQNTGLVADPYHSYNVNTTYLTVWDTTLFLSTEQRSLFRSDNRGELWSISDTGITGTVRSLAAIGEQLFVATPDGIFGSTDRGHHWLPILSGKSINCLVATATYLFAGTPKGVNYSKNGGTEWDALSDGLPADPVTALYIKNNFLFAGIAGGGTYRLPLKGIVSAAMPSVNTAAKTYFHLAVTRGAFTVTFSLQQPEPVSLALYSPSGRLVQNATLRSFSAGTHSFTIDGKNLPTGCYVLQIATAKNQECREFMHVR